MLTELPPTSPTPCQCLLAGYCPTHERPMPEHFWRLCREQPGYFEAFQQSKHKWTGEPQRGLQCVHRGPIVGEGTADLCGRKGQRFPIYHCALHAECVIGAFCKRQKWRSCLTCPDQWSS